MNGPGPTPISSSTAWAQLDLGHANALLDEMGLTERSQDGIRKLPDGRPLSIVVENALQIITDTWRDIGVRLVMRPFRRDTLRSRVYSGVSMASVWYGWDNGIPTLDTSPDYLAPRAQEFFAWPKWGQYFQTGGDAGEAPDMAEAIRLLDELGKPYVETARAKGLPPVKLLTKYPLRMAFNPFVADIGNLLPSLISGSVLVSVVLGLQTIGPALLTALKSQDQFLAGFILLFVALLTLIGTMISDVLLMLLDPRIRYGGRDT